MTPAQIKEARQMMGLDQRQMARLLGYKASTRVSDLETGKRNPGGAVVRLLQAYLDGYRPTDWPEICPQRVNGADRATKSNEIKG